MPEEAANLRLDAARFLDGWTATTTLLQEALSVLDADLRTSTCRSPSLVALAEKIEKAIGGEG